MLHLGSSCTDVELRPFVFCLYLCVFFQSWRRRTKANVSALSNLNKMNWMLAGWQQRRGGAPWRLCFSQHSYRCDGRRQRWRTYRWGSNEASSSSPLVAADSMANVLLPLHDRKWLKVTCSKLRPLPNDIITPTWPRPRVYAIFNWRQSRSNNSLF